MELDYEYELLANEARPEGRKWLGSKPLQNAWIRSFDLPTKEFVLLDKETQQELVEKVPSFKEFGGNRDNVELTTVLLADPSVIESQAKRVFCLDDRGTEESNRKQ